GIKPAPKGTPQIEVTFKIDVNGIVSVTAKDKQTNEEKTITISNSGNLSDSEIDKMIKDAEENQAADELKKKNIELKNKAESYINIIENGIKESGDKLDDKQKEEQEKLINEIKELINNENYEELEKKMNDLEQAMQMAAQYAQSQNENSS